ncbi:MAG: hypothetical protein J0I14_18930 [Propionibacteriaceae bacterium]|nr:hypothetical protein [Propionibacteriaceae bacterium]
MKAEPIDAAKLAMRALRAMDDAQRAVRDGWERLTGQAQADPHRTPNDRRQPPEVW